MKKTFENALDDYASYHKNPKNKLTHYFGIPMIVYTVIVFLRMIDLPQVGPVNLDGALLTMVPVGIFYLMLNVGTGVGMLLIFAGMYLLAPMITWPVALGAFIFGWILQFVGHHYEGRKPAFFKNGVHLLIGPLWILNDLYSKLSLPAYTPKPA
ncbi:MAG: DUF962 domain-containing protein [Acidobacteriota bacterium]|nr:DUF962 domain-containing protein [Acidobacteriota bacterium]